MPYVRTKDGSNLYYDVHDYTDPWRSAPALILQHGFGRSNRFWFNLIPYLCRYYRIICPDLRGLGQSSIIDPNKVHTLEDYVDDIIAIADDLGLDTFHYAGESLGGIIGYVLSAERKERVRSLSVFASPLYVGEATKETFAFGRLSWADAMKEMGVEAWAANVNAATRFPPDTDQGLMDWYATEMGKSDLNVLIAMSRTVVGANATEYLARIEAPVLCFYPTSGAIATSDQEQILVSNVKNIRVIHLPSTYHMSHFLKPATSASCLLNFMCLIDGELLLD